MVFHTPPKTDYPNRGLEKHEGNAVSYALQSVNIHLTERSSSLKKRDGAIGEEIPSDADLSRHFAGSKSR